MDGNWIMIDKFKLVIGEISLHIVSYETFNFFSNNLKKFINIL